MMCLKENKYDFWKSKSKIYEHDITIKNYQVNH